MYTSALDINNWLRRHRIFDYTLVPSPIYGFVVDVSQTVHFEHLDLSLGLLVKFNKVNKDFSIWKCGLTSLKGCPDIVTGSFSINYNNVSSLIGGPKVVKKDYNCPHNKLTSLEGGAEYVGRDYDCSYNALTSLKGSPLLIQEFDCNGNFLPSLEFGPTTVKGNMYAYDNLIEDFTFLPNKEDIKILSMFTNDEKKELKIYDAVEEKAYIYNLQKFHKEKKLISSIISHANSVTIKNKI